MDCVDVVNELLGVDFVIFLLLHSLDRVVHVVLDRAIQAIVSTDDGRGLNSFTIRVRQREFHSSMLRFLPILTLTSFE